MSIVIGSSLRDGIHKVPGFGKRESCVIRPACGIAYIPLVTREKMYPLCNLYFL